jgi:hypothetical protein
VAEDDLRVTLSTLTEELWVNTRFTFKGHHRAETVYGTIRSITGLPAVVLAAIASAVALSDGPFIAALILCVAGLRALGEFVDPTAKAASHRDWAVRYHSLNDRVRDFYHLSVRCADVDDTKVRMGYDALQQERIELNSSSPSVPHWAYWLAGRSLRKESAFTPAELSLLRHSQQR